MAEGRWIMHSRVLPEPGKTIEFFIGCIRVAWMHWDRGNTVLVHDDGSGRLSRTSHASTADAMKHMHERLKSPPDFVIAESLEG